MVRATYLVMELIGWLSLSVVHRFLPHRTCALSLGTVWGIFRHYWVLMKLLMTIPATLILLVHMRPIGLLQDAAAQRT